MKRSVLFIVIAAILLAACSTAANKEMALRPGDVSNQQAGYGGGSAPVEMPGVPPASDAVKTTTESYYQSNVPTSGSDAQNRLVIYNVNLSIIVKDVNARARAIQDMAKQMGGYVVSVNAYQTYASNGVTVPQAEVTIRVPADKLDDALAQIKADTVEVRNETRSGQDVTDQYVDLQSRVKAKQAAADQLTKIMEQATKTEDVLAVYQQLQQVETDIEVLKGQIKYYEDASAYSAISVSVVAEASIQPIEVGGWKPQGTVRDAVQDLLYFFQNFVDFLIWFVINFLVKLLTYAIVFGVPLWLIVRSLRKAMKKNKAAQTPPPQA